MAADRVTFRFAGLSAPVLSFGVLVGCAVPTEPVGPVDAPRVAEVLGRPVHARSALEMERLILRELTDRYAAERDIAVTQAEVDAYVEDMRRVMATRPSAPAAADDAATQEARAQVARVFILQRKIDGALQRQYGGRIAAMPGGAIPVDAYRKFLEEQAAQGRFRILDPAYESEFWRIYSDDSRYRFLPAGSDRAARAFEVPARPQ
jgi:hypothetical protein